MRLDNNDYKILDLLSKNSKLRIKEIAGKLKLKMPTVAYHLSKLSKHFVRQPIIDYYKFGVTPYNFYIKLKDFEDETKEEIEEFSKKFKEVYKVSHLNGTFDIMISLYIRNNESFAKFYVQLLKKFSKKMIFRDITIPYKKIIITGNIFGTTSNNPILIAPNRALQLSKNETKMLDVFTTLKTTKQISIETQLDEKTIRRYIRNNEKKKVILGYTINILPNLELYEKYFVRFNVGNKNDLVAQLGRTKGVMAIEFPIGKWDVEAYVLAKSHYELSKIIKNTKSAVPSISKYDILYIEKEVINNI
ncbi:Lrp/AsnC family transcriptional regulator [Candidatus Micrarchaeota archaeon]|nr:Lrp/AsnC family transcriptional regulator [Candidatus Micrarchaeota archaeon]